VEQTARREIHALTFTSAPAITAFLATATEDGLDGPVLEALRGEVLAACVGPVCARPLTDAGIPVVWPERGRLGALVRTLTETLPARNRRTLTVADRQLVLQGNVLLVDGESHVLSPKGATLLRALADRPGWVLSRAQLLRRAWSDTDADEHAVEAAIARLRQSLGRHSDLVRTVPKRGYRLAAV
jgi:uroporphyrinogen-III synthase